MRLLIEGGTVVTPTGTYHADVMVEDGVIAAVGRGLSGDMRIDARGCFVLPGLVDPHVHMGFRSGEFVSSDDFHTGTRAAAFGGVTTIIDFAVPEEGETLPAALKRRLEEAANASCIDFAVHVAINRVTPTIGEEIRECIAAGCSVFRLYMVYPGMELSDGNLYRVLREVRAYRGMVRVHAENASIIRALTEDYLRKEEPTPYHHYLTRPEFVEEEAVARMLRIQRETDCPVYFNHVSTGSGLRLIQEAKAEGRRVFAEVCPQYLFLSAEVYREEEGALYLASPAFKSDDECQALWRGIELGMVDAIGTDHCPYTRKQKLKYAPDFTRIPNGVPGVETTLPLLFTEWRRRGWPLERLVALTSYGPSRIFGLYPRKGTIQPGADADIVVFDPEVEWEIQAERLHMNVDWNPYEGIRCVGKARTVLLRGRALIEDGEWVAEERWGAPVTTSG